jgi:hypothetical protein
MVTTDKISNVTNHQWSLLKLWRSWAPIAVKLLIMLGGPVGPLPPICFSFWKFFSRGPSKFWWCYGQMALPKSCLADFWLPPPPTPSQFITNSPILAGGYSPPRAMDRQIIAMLEHHKFPGWCSNIARFFVSASPAVRSDAQEQKTYFFTTTMMIKSAVRIMIVSPPRSHLPIPCIKNNLFHHDRARPIL